MSADVDVAETESRMTPVGVEDGQHCQTYKSVSASTALKLVLVTMLVGDDVAEPVPPPQEVARTSGLDCANIGYSPFMMPMTEYLKYFAFPLPRTWPRPPAVADDPKAVDSASLGWGFATTPPALMLQFHLLLASDVPFAPVHANLKTHARRLWCKPATSKVYLSRIIGLQPALPITPFPHVSGSSYEEAIYVFACPSHWMGGLWYSSWRFHPSLSSRDRTFSVDVAELFSTYSTYPRLQQRPLAFCPSQAPGRLQDYVPFQTVVPNRFPSWTPAIFSSSNATRQYAGLWDSAQQSSLFHDFVHFRRFDDISTTVGAISLNPGLFGSPRRLRAADMRVYGIPAVGSCSVSHSAWFTPSTKPTPCCTVLATTPSALTLQDRFLFGFIASQWDITTSQALGFVPNIHCQHYIWLEPSACVQGLPLASLRAGGHSPPLGSVVAARTTRSDDNRPDDLGDTFEGPLTSTKDQHIWLALSRKFSCPILCLEPSSTPRTSCSDDRRPSEGPLKH
ncbi:hypothetical protein FPV67DRAFT_1456801 [Lyophyllum atratum]|nr:hypothetical protein FPV67DRAFT_1456801 [Lyophyllum atratum]